MSVRPPDPTGRDRPTAIDRDPYNQKQAERHPGDLLCSLKSLGLNAVLINFHLYPARLQQLPFSPLQTAKGIGTRATRKADGQKRLCVLPARNTQRVNLSS